MINKVDIRCRDGFLMDFEDGNGVQVFNRETYSETLRGAILISGEKRIEREWEGIVLPCVGFRMLSVICGDEPVDGLYYNRFQGGQEEEGSEAVRLPGIVSLASIQIHSMRQDLEWFPTCHLS